MHVYEAYIVGIHENYSPRFQYPRMLKPTLQMCSGATVFIIDLHV